MHDVGAIRERDFGEDGLTVVDEFGEALAARVAEARLRLAEAAATADSRAVAEALDELEEALAAARKFGIDVPATGNGKETTER